MKNVKIPKWLEQLPLAPEFRPTDTEFADPIAYISKIEKEASAFGICKVIPPLPKPSKKYILRNLNRSLSKCPELGSDVSLVNVDSGVRHNCDRTVNNGENRAVFTTRQQELGCEKGKKVKGAAEPQKQVWQSGEVYTIEQFEAKSKNFARSLLGTVKDVNPIVIEAMFWKAASEKPIYVEYANDVPGSGFGEPEGSLRYFARRRRKRRKRNSFDRNFVGKSNSKNDGVDEVNSTRDEKVSGSQDFPNLNTVASSNLIPPFCGRKDFQGGDEMEGTAGWKLSNSPWNLQVIARSPGSLTRFMPDDIPGVTSPMVYIGMLFSWFAWHVEDHELHSLNFLHMGSPKTWYSVPGDYAVNFEEAIRVHAYGVDADRMVALSLLGEKTTVLSPEVIVSSGIPCCRLVQNPGEFVVTFPRAYHIGFSHGFNCGEAANFGTPQWLSIAKEAAVRRAAMNYLPMLSHQQLLYLLTMSFISRMPRSLLPGVRSSRLKDRQKEERELLVKRAFIEDILHENCLLTVLLRRNSSCRAVLWDVESMPSSAKETKVYMEKNADIFTSAGKEFPENDDNLHEVGQLGDYIDAIGFDLNDDGLPYKFQIESGTLPCVACGILGFPFMTVLQPSDKASVDLLSNLGNVVEGSAKDVADKAKLNKMVLHRVNEDSSVAETSHYTISSKAEIVSEWNTSDVTLKPRIFCLEHAIEIEKLLSSKGGANILVICHSDFQKIKSHAASTAEEIGLPFRYTEIPLVNASEQDLNLIDIAIAQEEKANHVDEWTSLLSINLQHCVRVKKSTPSKNVRHLLNLGGLFCDPSSQILNASGIKWVSKKLRSNCFSKKVQSSGIPSEEMTTGEDDSTAKKEIKIIHYSRKRYKARACAEKRGPDDKIGNSSRNSEAKAVEVNEIPIDEVNEPAEGCDDEEKGSTQCNLPNCTDENAFTQSQPDEQLEEKIISGHNETVSESTSTLIEEHKGKNVFSTGKKVADYRNAKTVSKRKREVDMLSSQSDQFDLGGFIRSPCEGLRSRARPTNDNKTGKSKNTNLSVVSKNEKQLQMGHYQCELDNCTMSFQTKAQLILHKGNRCPVQGCRKRFNSHKYAVQHARVHDDDRPLKCTWAGCTMSFKWAWARTEHLRLHTGERPYTCKVDECGLTFRFMSDYSRHRRKTGHFAA
ncbi:Probable lysine-specific demethylase ELF6 [Striga hermonthica]|uniref:Probable lysine-specific demethylase ELF6 n=1 Tax=Striga hermonthica TaxID=68872 RepID=A0A9N7N887_STRHE|nr:Probable lysine-specific demethylase ELF6 [Striga hermonthica]